MLAIQLFFVAAITAAPTIINHVLHEERQTPSSDWIKGVRIEGDAILPMRIGLTQSNLEKGHELLMEVSVDDPAKSDISSLTVPGRVLILPNMVNTGPRTRFIECLHQIMAS
jgi:hypothetical protein